MSNFNIRFATAGDAKEIARLLTLLGHATTAAEVEMRWADWTAHGNSALVATRDDTTLAALATLHQTHVLHRPKPVGRITALVVDASDRGQGLGHAVVAAAERELASAGCGLLEITSNVRRTDAHAFYERIGYDHTSVRLAKTIDR